MSLKIVPRSIKVFFAKIIQGLLPRCQKGGRRMRVALVHDVLDWQNEKSGWPGALRQGLHDLGWTESPSWTWSHPGLQTTLSFIEQDAGWKDHVREVRHLLRESWRRTFFHKWLAMDRVDSRECAGTIYSAPRVKILRLLHLSSHEVAVVTGAQVSPARFEKMIPGSRFSCPWCGGEGERATWRHCAWDCTFAPRPPDVSFASCFDVMQHRLGWPSGLSNRKALDGKILRWLAAVRRRCLEVRRS